MEKSTLLKLNPTIIDIYRWKTYFQLTFAFDVNFPKFKKYLLDRCYNNKTSKYANYRLLYGNFHITCHINRRHLIN